MQKNWYDRPQKCVAINMWSPKWYHDGIINLDIPLVARRCYEVGAETVYMWQGWSQDHFGRAYYPTRKGPWHPNLQPGADHMRDLIRELHGYGIKVVGYYSYYDQEVWERETDWREVNSEGQSDVDGASIDAFGELCPNSPYHEYVIARQTELAELYDLDAMCLLDSARFDQSEAACYCKYCQAKYKARYGLNIPTYSGEWTPEWDRYVKWKQDCMAELFDDLKAAIHHVNPDMPVTHLAFGMRGDVEAFGAMPYERVAQADDFVNSIASWTDALSGGRVARKPSYIWSCGMLTRYLRAIGGKSVHTHIGRFMYTREYQTVPLHELETATASITAAGGSPSIADNLYPDGRLDEAAFEKIGQVFRGLDGKMDWLGYDDEAPYAALFYSNKTMAYLGYAQQGENSFLKTFEGAYKFLIEQHIPFKLISDRGLTADYLQKIKLLVLPNCVVLSDEQCEMIRAFVKNGGSLLATGRSSCVADNGLARDNFGLADVFGADLVNPSNYTISYIDVVNERLSRNIELREYAICRGIQVKTNARPGAEVGAYLVQPATEVNGRHRHVTYAQDVHPGYPTTVPAALMNPFGKGKCIYLSSDATAVFGVYGYSGMRNLLANSVDWLVDGEYLLSTDTYRTVELSPYVCGSQLRVHVVNYAYDGLNLWMAEGGNVADRSIPTGDFKLTVRCAPELVTNVSLVGGGQMSFTREADRIIITMPSVDTYEILVIEGYQSL